MTAEEETISELKAMSKEELDMVEFKLVWWICSAKGCCGGTKVRDYGISPEYWKKQYKFFSIHDRFILCSKHWPLYKRLIKNYSWPHIERRLMDFGKKFIMTDEEKKAATPKRTKKTIPQMNRKKNR